MDTILVVIGIVLCVELVIIIVLLNKLCNKAPREIVISGSTEKATNQANTASSGRLTSEQANVTRSSVIICPNCYGAIKHGSRTCQFCGNMLTKR